MRRKRGPQRNGQFTSTRFSLVAPLRYGYCAKCLHRQALTPTGIVHAAAAFNPLPPCRGVPAVRDHNRRCAGFAVCRDTRRLVLASRLPSRAAPTCEPHSARCSAGCHTSRDFVPWRFLDAGQLSVRSVSVLPASKNQHKRRHYKNDRCRRILDIPCWSKWAAKGSISGVHSLADL